MRTRRRSYSLTPLGLYPTFSSVIERFTRDGLAFDPDGYIIPVVVGSYPAGNMHSTNLLGTLIGGGGDSRDTSDMNTFVSGGPHFPLEGIDPMAMTLPTTPASWALKRLMRFIRDLFGLFQFPFPDQTASPFHLLWRRAMTSAAVRTAYVRTKAAYQALHGDGRTFPWSSYLDDDLCAADGQWRSRQGDMEQYAHCIFDYRVIISFFPVSEQSRVRMVGRTIGIDPLTPVPYPLVYAAMILLVPDPTASDESHFTVRLYSTRMTRSCILSVSITDPSKKWTRSCTQIRTELDGLRSTVHSLQCELDSRRRH